MADDKEPSDDLRTLISQSFDESTAAAAEPVETKTVPAADAATGKVEAKDNAGKGTDGDLVRGADGKFRKKEEAAGDKADAKATDDKAKPEGKEAAKPEAKADGAVDDKAATEKAAGADGKDAPANWSASDKAMFNLQTPEAKEFLLRRHRAMQGDYDKKSAAIADLKKEFEPIQQMFAPHLEVLKSKGLTPAATIRAWANVETQLANGKGIDVIRGMIHGYDIDKAALGKALGFTSTTAAERSTETAADPAAAASGDQATMLAVLEAKLAQQWGPKLAKIDQWETQQRTQQTTAAQEREAKVETEITNFKTATDEKGELKHPYYDEVEPAMIALAQSYAASKQPLPPLPELYETAVWANPSTRAAMQAAQKAADEAKRTEEARAKAASARRAGSSVTGAPGSGQATAPIRGEMSLREQLEEAAAQ